MAEVKRAKVIKGGLGKLILKQRVADKKAADIRAEVKAAKFKIAKAASSNPSRTTARSAIKKKQ